MIDYQQFTHRFLSFFIALNMLILLSACGGGGSVSGDPSNTPAVISGDVSGDITEDSASDSSDLLQVSGKLSITDVDSGQAFFIAQDVVLSSGAFTFDVNGNWNFSVDNGLSEIQGLADGSTITVDLVVQSVDGTEQIIVITVLGVNDIPVISGDISVDVAEDSSDNSINASGKLDIIDTDIDESELQALDVSGTYGNLILDADGNWSYLTSSNNSDIQALINDDFITDSFTVSSVDGTTYDFVLTISSLGFNLNWEAPAQREDSTVLDPSEISGYRIYHGSVQGDYFREFDTKNNDRTLTTQEIPVTDYFVMTAYDNQGRESLYSPEIRKAGSYRISTSTQIKK